MANPFVHVELHASDTAAAKKFYGELLDWSMKDEDMGGMTYTMISPGEGTGGGMMKNPVAGAPSHWLAYVQVDDAAAAASKAEKLGGKIVQAKTDLPGGASFAIITDPTGAAVGLFQQGAS